MNSTLIWVVKPVRKLDTASQWLKAMQNPPGEPSSYPSLDKHQTQITPSAMAGFLVPVQDLTSRGMQSPEIRQNNQSIEGFVIHSSITYLTHESFFLHHCHRSRYWRCNGYSGGCTHNEFTGSTSCD